MKYMKFFAFCAVLAFAFSASACEWESNNIEHFGHHLQGTWVSNYNQIYTGYLVITFDSITITGFHPNQTPPPFLGGNDANRPFRNFTRDAALRGHSEDGQRTDMSIAGHIFIWDVGVLQAPLSYTYWWTGGTLSNREYFLTFSFNDVIHTFRWAPQ